MDKIQCALYSEVPVCISFQCLGEYNYVVPITINDNSAIISICIVPTYILSQILTSVLLLDHVMPTAIASTLLEVFIVSAMVVLKEMDLNVTVQR